MSKTWKRHGGWKDGSHEAKKSAARTFRARTKDIESIPNGGFYKRFTNSWDICDWNCTLTIEQERYEFHHPLTNYGCMCDTFSYCRYSWTRRINWEAPEPVMVDRTWVLPSDFVFRNRWNAPIQRVNPETGAYEKKVCLSRWVWKHEVAWEYYCEGPTRHSRCRYKDMDWRAETYEAWVLNDSPEVYRLVEAPYFTEDDIRRHVESREEQTRNFRKKERFPRYWRRDRKRARRLKGQY